MTVSILFYSNYVTPCGTIGVTDCSELDNLAAIMKEINQRYTFNEELTGELQRLDGYTPTIFFDYGDLRFQTMFRSGSIRTIQRAAETHCTL